LTLFYTKREIALRIGYLFVSTALAGVCGLLAYGIGSMDGVAGQAGSYWIFIIEGISPSSTSIHHNQPCCIGIPTALSGFTILFLLANDPELAWFLQPEEKKLIIIRLARQSGFTRSVVLSQKRCRPGA
jgi:hypothetical protein